MRSKHSLPIAAASALLALTAVLCACSTQATTPSHTQEQPKMTSTTHEKSLPGLYTLAEYPQFTPQEVGKRILALIDSLKSFDDLSLEHIRKVTGFPMTHTPPGINYVFGIHLPESNWHYWIEYSEDQVTKEKGGALVFTNPSATYSDALIDMAPVCLDYDDYVSKLKQMGFKEAGSTRHELGWVLDTSYIRGNVGVKMVERREADQTEAKAAHACLLSLAFGLFTAGQ